MSTAEIQAAWQSADTWLPPLYLESLNNEAFCGLVSSAGPSESLHIFVCAVTNGVTHSPTWGHLGTCSVLLTIAGGKSDIKEVIKKKIQQSHRVHLCVFQAGGGKSAGLRSLPRAPGGGAPGSRWDKFDPLLLRSNKREVKLLRNPMSKAETVDFLPKPESPLGPRKR